MAGLPPGKQPRLWRGRQVLVLALAVGAACLILGTAIGAAVARLDETAGTRPRAAATTCPPATAAAEEPATTEPAPANPEPKPSDFDLKVKILVPYAPARPCAEPGCPGLTRWGRRCLEHARAYERARGSAARRGYDRRWQMASEQYLQLHPWCVCGPDCCPDGCDRPATDVHHLDGHGPPGPRGYDPTNWAGLARGCHSRQTVAHDGGFGRPRRRP